MKHMRRQILLLALVLGLIVIDRVPAQLEPFGLEGKTVTSLSLPPRLPYRRSTDFVCAGTDSSGVYKRNLTSPDSQWINLGLENKRILSIHVHHWGAGPGDFNTIFAGLHPVAGDTTFLYRYTDGIDTTWVSSDSGLDTGHLGQIRAIGGFDYGGHLPPQPLFIGDGQTGKVFRSYDWRSWEEVFDVALAVNVIQATQDWQNWSNWAVWAGGETGYFAPFLAKSLDRGETWEVFIPDLGGDNSCYSIAVDPQHPDTVYAGMRETVVKTTDGGQTWLTTSLHDLPILFNGVVVDSTDPEHVYAGGTSVAPRFALFETFDGGDSWQAVSPPDTLKGISSLAFDSYEGILYIATLGSGVWRYRSEIAGIQKGERKTLPQDFVLCQNYPNPFNPTTTIEFSMPRSGFVRLTVYDLLGREVSTLVNTWQEAGEHSVKWDATNVSSGIYLVRMESERFSQVRKLMVLR